MNRLIIPALVLAASACTFVRRTPGDIQQAIWVTRFDYQTEQDVRNIIRNCAQAGFDTVLFQVRGNGTVFYRSSLEPWAEQFRFRYPGFDPLGVACHEARETGVSLHAWVNACPGWRGDKAPSLESQLFHARPSWFLYDQNRKRQDLIKDFYVWLNPCLPEVRDYVASICEEIALRYPVAGIHLDYIRMPHGRVETGGQDYPRDLRTLELYEAESGKTPDMDLAAWGEWKTRQLTTMVTTIRKRLREARPRLILSAAVMRTPELARTTVHQDWASWLNQGLVDLVLPMQYDDDDERFASRVASCVEAASTGRVVMGIGVYKHKKPFQTLRQMDLATELGSQGYCLFSYKEFFDEKGKVTAKGKRILNTVRARALSETLE